MINVACTELNEYSKFKLCFNTSIIFVFLLLFNTEKLESQDGVLHVTKDMFTIYNTIPFHGNVEWKYTTIYDSLWLDSNYIDDHWQSISIKNFSPNNTHTNGIVEAWFRIKIKVDSTIASKNMSIRVGTKSALSLYINGNFFKHYGIPDIDSKYFRSYSNSFQLGDPLNLIPGEDYTLAFYFVDHHSYWINKLTNKRINLDPFIHFSTQEHNKRILESARINRIVYFWLGPLLLLCGLFWFMYFQNREEKIIFLVAIFTTALFILCYSMNLGRTEFRGLHVFYIFEFLSTLSSAFAMSIIPLILDKLITRKISPVYKYAFWFFFLTNCIGYFVLDPKTFQWMRLTYVLLLIPISIHVVFRRRALIRAIQWVILIGMILTIFFIIAYLVVTLNNNKFRWLQNSVVTGIYLTMPVSMLIYFTLRFKSNLDAARENAEKVLHLSKEKENLIETQKHDLEVQVKSRTEELVKSLAELKATQNQLIQQEKLASLGQLTAGIAHEIKNPLNFVNNFSEVSRELIEEIKEERAKSEEARDETLVDEILQDLESNLDKIHEHGSRANGIVSSMLQHSREGSGKKEPKDINALIKEYVNLSFHGMRAGKNPINLDIQLDFDESIDKVDLVVEDFSRVILNLCNNAFDAMRATAAIRPPKLSVRTKLQSDKILIEIEDNGSGIPDEIKDKILQPFFTTKKGTEGTGLGLSITHDIVKAHGGKLTVESQGGKGSAFIVQLPC
jgi:two-component system, NtrC family, sensor kinase